MRIGLECCLDDPPAMLDGNRFGLLMNQASVDSQFRYACDLLAAKFPGQLAAIFSPQHGLWGEQQANMIESPHGWYEPLGVPVYSLYSEARRPTSEMLRDLDCLVVELQDVGTRVYTFVWTVSHCLEACAEADIPMLILDRPNPLGGEIIEGPLLECGFESFVGRASIPMRHGLTIGELARLVNHELSIGARLEVVSCEDWQPRHLWSDLERVWVAPSPNMPRFETALLYPGQVLLEGSNLSEGRGTTLPFEVAGAPFLDPHQLLRELERFEHSGLRLRPIRFVPTFDKWRGQSCGGVAWHIVDPPAVRSFASTIAFLTSVQRLAPREFAWTEPPYEYEATQRPIDILFGSSRLRELFASHTVLTPAQVAELVACDVDAWQRRTDPFRTPSSTG